jgi:arylformamidase
MNPALAVWPGDAPFRLQSEAQIAAGALVNVTSLRLSAHTGTHADAFHHYVDGATTMDDMDLTLYWGMAQVVTVDKPAGPLFSADLAAYDLTRAPRLLLRTSASQADPTRFFRDYVYPDPSLAAALGGYGIRLLGTDAASVDPPDSTTLAGHHALYAAGVAILEGLALAHVADGLYELVALPLKIAGGDGSPVRAALRRPGG